MIPHFTPARIYRPPVILEPRCKRADLEALRGLDPFGRVQLSRDLSRDIMPGDEVVIRTTEGLESTWRVQEVRGGSWILEAK